MTAAEIASSLGLKRNGRTWRGPCPVHGGQSFTVSERDGRVLFFCWAGCDQRTILGELRRRGLWPERERQTFTEAERRAYGRRLRLAEVEARVLIEWRRDWLDWMTLEAMRAWWWFRVARVMVTASCVSDVERGEWMDVSELNEEWGLTLDRLKDSMGGMSWNDLNRVRRSLKAA